MSPQDSEPVRRFSTPAPLSCNPRNRRCVSMGDLHRRSPKPERFARSGNIVIFENEESQRRAQDKIQELVNEVSTAKSPNNALIAKKVLKYRKFHERPNENCIEGE